MPKSPTSFLSRRTLLSRGLIGCCLAASPAFTPITLASAPGNHRLVVIVLRGGMDGLDIVRPVGDANFQAVRPSLAGDTTGPLLDNFFALHPGLGGLMPLWRAGSLGFVHAVSTPYRDKRSHFEGQDVLEAGLPQVDGITKPESGWLNRLVGLMPGATARTAFSVGREGELLLKGEAPATSWHPDTALTLSTQGERLMQLVYETDPLFGNVASQAFELIAENDPDAVDPKTPGHQRVADYLAAQLRGDTRLATFSISGWDTHGRQKQALKKPVAALAETILRLQQQLGPVWDQTTILAMTEFGRSVRENGTAGTDHGTGGAMLIAGGAVRGGQVHGDWPGLDEAALYDRRDLMPTGDIRAIAAGAIAALFGTQASDLSSVVFPGLDLTEAPTSIIL